MNRYPIPEPLRVGDERVDRAVGAHDTEATVAPGRRRDVGHVRIEGVYRLFCWSVKTTIAELA